ncbi:MAG: glycosyltransferase [Gemmatimonadota bacterium]
MKIHLVLPGLYVGGMERLVIHLAVVMRRRGHDVRIVSLDGDGPLDAHAQELDVRVDHVPSRGWRTLVGASPLSRYFERERPDIVHSHAGSWARAVTAARQAGVRGRVQTLHGFHEKSVLKMRWIDRALMPLTPAVVAVSEELRVHMVRELWTSDARIGYVRNGVLQPPAPPVPLDRTTIGLHDDEVVTMVVGRLVPVKALDVLLTAFATVSRADARARLVIVGEGPERAALEAQRDALGLQRVVSLLGTRNDVPALLASADVFCLPSHSEGLSISLLEAMAGGLPVVATAVGSTPEVVTPEVGLLVPPGQPDLLAAALQSLHADASRRERMGAAAAERVRERYSVEATADAYLQLYESLLQRIAR